MASSISAEIIGNAARYDQQLLVPVLPAVRRGVAVTPRENGMMVCGAPRPQALTGHFARTDLPRLLEKCDGTRTHARLAEEMGLTEDAAFKALALLWSCGVIEDQEAEITQQEAPTHLATYLSRLGDSTGVRRHWTEALYQLRTTVIAVAGDDALVPFFENLLRASCCCVAATAEDADIVVFLDTPRSRPCLQEAGEGAWSREIPFLRVAVAEDVLEVGPYIDPSFTPCLDCALSCLKPLTATYAQDGTACLALGIACRTIVALISRTLPTHLPGDIRATDLRTLHSRYVPPATRAGCPVCSAAEGPMASVPSLAARYEQSVAIPARKFVDIKGHQAHYQPSNLNLQYQFRTFSSAPRSVLPEPRPELLDGPPAGLNLETLGLVLYYAAGLRPRDSSSGKLRRWTAAGGNIGSVGARVVIRDPMILPPGTYAYIESDHSLRRLGAAADGLDAPVTLILTANIEKVAKKYGSFALRVSIEDGGCAALTALRVSRALGISWTPVARWNERALCASCDAIPSAEPITSVALLGVTDAH